MTGKGQSGRTISILVSTKIRGFQTFHTGGDCAACQTLPPRTGKILKIQESFQNLASKILKIQDLAGKILKIQDLVSKILKIQDLAGKILKIQDLAGKNLKIQYLAGKILKIQDLAGKRSATHRC